MMPFNLSYSTGLVAHRHIEIICLLQHFFGIVASHFGTSVGVWCQALPRYSVNLQVIVTVTLIFLTVTLVDNRHGCGNGRCRI